MTLENVSLTGNSSSKISYTKRELKTCQDIGTIVMVAADVFSEERLEKVDQDLIEIVKACAGEQNSAKTLCRAAYREVERSHFEDVDDKSIKALDPQNWPHPRDYTSVTLMFRKGLKSAGVDQETIDQLFPHKTYTKGKKKVVVS